MTNNCDYQHRTSYVACQLPYLYLIFDRLSCTSVWRRCSSETDVAIDPPRQLLSSLLQTVPQAVCGRGSESLARREIGSKRISHAATHKKYFCTSCSEAIPVLHAAMSRSKHITRRYQLVKWPVRGSLWSTRCI